MASDSHEIRTIRQQIRMAEYLIQPDSGAKPGMKEYQRQLLVKLEQKLAELLK